MKKNNHSKQLTDSSISSIISGPNPDDDNQDGTETAGQERLSESSEQLQAEIEYFFMNPIDKWKKTKAFPWKLALQFFKLVIVTFHVTSIGFEMANNMNQEFALRATLDSIMLQNWSTNRLLKTYPPSDGPFGVYTKSDLYSAIDHAIKSIANLTQQTVSTTAYDSESPDQVSTINLIINEYTKATLDPFTFHYNIDLNPVTREVIIAPGYKVGDSRWNSFSIESYLALLDQSINFDKLLEISLVTHLKTIHINSMNVYNPPACYIVLLTINFSSPDLSGLIILSLSTKYFHQECQGNLKVASDFQYFFQKAVAIIIAVLSTTSSFLCFRSLALALNLRWKVYKFFLKHFDYKLTMREEKKFFDPGLIIILINDFLLTCASTIMLFHFTDWDSNNWIANRYSVFYGLGILLTWFCLLRYVASFDQFNTLLKTMQKSAPDIVKFILCASFIFIGYCLSGWIVLGPYHLKFRTLSKTAECLFSLINADDMFATFYSLQPIDGFAGILIWCFSRIYIYSFVCLFIYVILSLLMTVIVDAWEVIKKQGDAVELTFLERFISSKDWKTNRESDVSSIIG